MQAATSLLRPYQSCIKQPPAYLCNEAVPMVTIISRFHSSVYTHYTSKQVLTVYRLLAIVHEMVATSLWANDGWYVCLFGLYQPNFLAFCSQIHIDVPRMNPEIPLFQQKIVQEVRGAIIFSSCFLFRI